MPTQKQKLEKYNNNETKTEQGENQKHSAIVPYNTEPRSGLSLAPPRCKSRQCKSGKGVDQCLNVFAKFSLTFIFIKNRVYVIVCWSVPEQCFLTEGK